MNVNNFRIGNIVMFAPKGARGSKIEPRICPVVKINSTQLIVKDLGFHLTLTSNNKALKLLPLSKQILLELGGELIEYGFDSDEGGLVCVIDFGVFTLKWSNEGKNWRVYRRMTKEYQSIEDLYVSKVRFAHEWQNLYFALTGKELTIND